MKIDQFIKSALNEDLNDPNSVIPFGDHTSQACVPSTAGKRARLLVKQPGVVAGIEAAKRVFELVDPELSFSQLVDDGTEMQPGEVAFTLEGKARSILTGERLALNIMQRMSGIATHTAQFVKEMEGTGVKILDTRKTTPNFRYFEKWAVRLGGGTNHRMGLYDMIMIKDNHIDYCGGITKAVETVEDYLDDEGISIKIEVEARNLTDVKEVLAIGSVDRVMLDNFSVEEVKEAIEFIDGRIETEVSGGITLKTVKSYAECKPNYISSGAIIYSAGCLDLSLKAFE